MNITKGKLFGLNIATNIMLPVDFTSNAFNNIDEKKILITNSNNYDMTFKTYTSDICKVFKYSNELNAYLIETDLIGSILVNKNEINYSYDECKTHEIVNEMELNRMAFTLSFGLGISMLLRLNSYIILHASCLEINKRTVLIMGRSGAGKSTLCSYLIKEGYARLIADDMASVSTNNYKLYNGFPMIKLWTHSLEGIFGEKADGYKNVGRKGKVYYPIKEICEQDEHKIDAVFILDYDRENPILAIDTLDKKEFILYLYRNIYNRASMSLDMLNTEMNEIRMMVDRNETKGFVIHTPHTYESLKIMADSIVDCIT